MENLPILDQHSAIFQDRVDAGQRLATQLQKYRSDNPLVLALPRGGVVVGYEVSKVLEIPLDVIVSRKIGAPYNPELGIGALSEGNIQILDEQIIQLLGLPKDEIAEIIKQEQKEMVRRIKLYRNNNPLPSLHTRTVILVDDGLATGVTAEASIKAVLQLQPHRLVIAVPVCDYETAETIRRQVDDFICLYSPRSLEAIGFYYQNFSQTTDEEVLQLLAKARKKYPQEFVN